MKELIAQTVSAKGKISIADTPLGRGGEGAVFDVLSSSISELSGKLVVKQYFETTLERRKKIAAMILNKPKTESIAWPQAMVFDISGNFIGYVMEKLDSANYRPISILSNTKDRRIAARNFDVKYALAASLNLAISISSIHHAGHIIGDINESNIFVANDSRIMIVDSDSAQISSPRGELYRCLVGKPEYTAPELSHGPLRDQNRTVESDCFALAIIIFQLLVGGAHPADAIFKGSGDPPSTVDKIRMGIYPSLTLKTAEKLTPVPRIATGGLPLNLRKLLLSMLSLDPKKRPDLKTIIISLKEVLVNLEKCKKVKGHWFDSRDESCGWCIHADKGNQDPWGEIQNPVVKQISLPNIDFSEEQESIVPKRAPAPNVNQQQSGANQQYASNNKQSVSGSTSTQTNDSSPPPIPNKIKGKTVLQYADGTHDIRPPLFQLFSSNPKLAIQCLTNETPDLLKIWWPQSRPDLPGILSSILGLIISTGISLVWLIFFPGWIYPHTGNNKNLNLVIYLSGIIAAIVGFLTASIMFIASMIFRIRFKKFFKTNEALPKTVLRYLSFALILGPGFVLFIVGTLVWLLLNLLGKIVSPKR